MANLLIRRRRWQLAAGAALLLAATGCAAQPRFSIPAARLDEALARRFPMRFPVAGLLALKLEPPRLRLLPDVNRISAELPLEASGPLLGRSYGGTVDLDFGLRYEPSDQSIRAHRLKVNAVRFPDLPPDLAQLLTAALPGLSEQALGEVVLQRLRPEDLAVPDSLGLQPGAITVTARGLVVDFVPRPLR
jgi:hypothetical protein